MRLIDDDEANHGYGAAHDGAAPGIACEPAVAGAFQGQRFGVLAGAPAFDAERLPVGPQQLVRLAHEASGVLQISPGSAAGTDAHVRSSTCSAGAEQLIEIDDALLARHNVLPGLSFVPLRTRPRSQQHSDRRESSVAPEAQSHSGGGLFFSVGGGGSGGAGGLSWPPAVAALPHEAPHTGWMGDVPESNPAAESAAFDLLQNLLAERRNLLGKLRPATSTQPKVHTPLPTRDVLGVLSKLQGSGAGTAQRHRSAAGPVAEGPRNRAVSRIALSREDSDTFELLGLLYTEIGRELREAHGELQPHGTTAGAAAPGSAAGPEFFVRQHHPARQLLNAVAESGARWLADDDADPQLGAQLRQAVDHVVENYDGDANVFEAADHALQEKLHSMAHKAEVTERRHVDAAPARSDWSWPSNALQRCSTRPCAIRNYEVPPHLAEPGMGRRIDLDPAASRRG